MKFVTDQDVYAATVRFVRSLGHEVTTLASLGLSQIDDARLLEYTEKSGCLLITRDRDFGALVFVEGLGAGVIYLRMLPSTQGAVHAEFGAGADAVLGDRVAARLARD